MENNEQSKDILTPSTVTENNQTKIEVIARPNKSPSLGFKISMAIVLIAGISFCAYIYKESKPESITSRAIQGQNSAQPVSTSP